MITKKGTGLDTVHTVQSGNIPLVYCDYHPFTSQTHAVDPKASINDPQQGVLLVVLPYSLWIRTGKFPRMG